MNNIVCLMRTSRIFPETVVRYFLPVWLRRRWRTCLSVQSNQIIFHAFRKKQRGLHTRFYGESQTTLLRFFLRGGGEVCTQANNLNVDTIRWYKKFTLTIVMSRWLLCFPQFVKLYDLNVDFIHLPFPYHVLRIPSFTRAQRKQPP